MSLSVHQRNLVEFFRFNSTGFVHHLLNSTTEKVTVIEDFLPFIVAYLDSELRDEIKLYQHQSSGYHRVLDMLIEAHIVVKGSEVSEVLVKEAQGVFKAI